jgi:hypothetical protein
MFEPSHTESFPLKMYKGTYILKGFPPLGRSSCSCHLQQSLNILLWRTASLRSAPQATRHNQFMLLYIIRTL